MRFNRGCGVCQIGVSEKLSSLLSEHGIKPNMLVIDRALSSFARVLAAGIPVMELSAGEQTKTLPGLEKIYAGFLEASLDKTSLVLVMGGGSVCDAAAFACATYQRGIPFVLAPSTLLAQVDAAIGGKNAINFAGVKNLIGTVTQPTDVLCATELLKNLPATEISNGLAEVIKHAAISSLEFFEWLEANLPSIRNLDQQALSNAIFESIKIKISIVERDELESSLRMQLNFGHTFGHAFEALQGIAHGAAVSLGMLVAAEISQRLGMLPGQEVKRLKHLLQLAGLPTEMPQQSKKELLLKVSQDKKRRGDQINLVLLKKLGEAQIIPIPLAQIEELLP